MYFYNILSVPKIFKCHVRTVDLCASNLLSAENLKASQTRIPRRSTVTVLLTLFDMTCHPNLSQVGLGGSIHSKLLTCSSSIYWRCDSLDKECSLYSGRMLRETQGIMGTSRTVRSSDLPEVKVIQLKKGQSSIAQKMDSLKTRPSSPWRQVLVCEIRHGPHRL